MKEIYNLLKSNNSDDVLLGCSILIKLTKKEVEDFFNKYNEAKPAGGSLKLIRIRGTLPSVFINSSENLYFRTYNNLLLYNNRTPPSNLADYSTYYNIIII